MSSELRKISPEANLVFFLHDRFEPALRNADKIDPSGSLIAIYSSLDLLESFLWLHLGVTIGYFPQPLSRRVVYEYSVPLFRAYGAILETNRIDTWLPQSLAIVLSEEFSGRAAMLNVPEPKIEPQVLDLSGIFQNAFLLSNGFAQLGEAARMVSAISLASDSMWQRSTVEERPGEIPSDERLHIELPKEGVSWSHEGFFEMVEYMKALPHLHEDAVPAFEKRAAERKPPLSQDMLNRERYALEEFFEQLKRVQQWRFNFGYPVPRERFLRIARSVAQSLVEFTSPTESTEEAVLRFQYEISELLYYWGAPRSKSAGA